MKLLLCWMAVHVCVCFGHLQPTIRQRAVSFHVANQTSMPDSGPVFSHVSKVKCTLICLERTSCTSVFFWRSEGKCRANTAQQAPAEQGGPDKATSQNPKVNRQTLKVNRLNPNSEVTKQDPERKIYYGVLRNALGLGQGDSEEITNEPANENSQAKTRIEPEIYIYFKEIGLSLIHHLSNESWREATSVCHKESGIMFAIDNQTKQDAAERLVELSGQELIFIGVFNKYLMWRYFGTDAYIGYKNWAQREPRIPSSVVALSRSSGYKWVGKGQHDTASWICAKRD